MTTQDTALDLAASSQIKWRHHAVTAGRIGLAILLLIVWRIGAERAGPIYIADPFEVFQRIVTDTMSGVLLKDIYATLRLSTIGFVIGCFFGVALPFVLRRMPRLTNAIEPYIMASVGVPKYALVPLFILWFGIDDAPKLWLVGLLVFYPVFIAVFAGIRNVDRRLINMARVVGASEAMISREVIWNSLLSFFLASLKIALPRAISAAIIGEFLVGNAGLGYMIEHSRQNFDTVGVFAGIVVATALVLLINAALVWVDRRVNAWRPTERDMQI
jgi:NitT/TauT family transport system permease protein